MKVRCSCRLAHITKNTNAITILILMLVQVWLPAIAGHVPDKMVRSFAAFFEFCYLVRLNFIAEDTLTAISEVLERYHNGRVIFKKLVFARTDSPFIDSTPSSTTT